MLFGSDSNLGNKSPVLLSAQMAVLLFLLRNQHTSNSPEPFVSENCLLCCHPSALVFRDDNRDSKSADLRMVQTAVRL